LAAYLRGDADARVRFPVEAHRILTDLAAHHGCFLPVDVREEVVNEAHLIMLERRSGFDPARGSAPVFLRFVVRDAVKRVAATYCPPGWRTRRSDVDAEAQRTAVLSLERHTEMGTVFCDTSAERTVERQCDLRTVFDRAPAGLGYALRRIYFLDESPAAVAKSLGVSRFTLLRRMQSYASSFGDMYGSRAVAA